MNIFIDCGTHYCQGLSHFIKILSIDKTWEIHAFEPNPILNTQDCVDKLDLNIKLHNKAVWIKDGVFNFKQYGSDGQSQGSLLEETNGDKKYADYFSSVEVETIDFYKFLKSFDESQEIYIKMDIECAEYEVLDYLLACGWPKNIKHIWIEWHRTDEDFFLSKSKFLTNEIVSNGCEVSNWI